MRFTAAASSLLATVAVVAPHSTAGFAPRRPAGRAFTDRAPTRGNVSYRKVKAWHNPRLDPWWGLKLRSAVDESLEVNGSNGDLATEDEGENPRELFPNGDACSSPPPKQKKEAEPEMIVADMELDASARAVRAEATEYLRGFVGQTGAGVVYSKLVEHGVEVVNGYSGGAVLPLLDQFSDENPRHGPEGSKIRWITNSNESSAGHVAEGIAKSSTEADGRLAAGVAVATSGPGMTNLITPMQDAMCDGVPMVVLCGQAATNAPCDAFQGAPAVRLAEPCTKWSYQIKSATELPFVMDYAFFVARHGRPGPVFVDLPKDLQVQPVTEDSVADYVENNLVFGTHSLDPLGPGKTFPQDHMPDNQPNLVRLKTLRDSRTNKDEVVVSVGSDEQGLPFTVADQRLEPVPPTAACKFHGVDAFRQNHVPSDRIFALNGDQNGAPFSSDLMDELVSKIQYARKPVIIAGQGTNDCPQELKDFAERAQIPVATTLHALGTFDERHPLALNMLGMHGHPTPNFMIQESDLIICVGSRFDDRITGNPGFFIPEAKAAALENRGGVIHVDVRLSEKGRQVEPTYFVHSTAKTFLTELNRYLKNNPKAASRKIQTARWLDRMAELQNEFPVTVPTFPTRRDADGRSETPVSAQYVVETMNRHILDKSRMDDFLFTTGVGIHQMVAAQLITWTKPRQMLSSGSLGTMGVALGYCVGAKLANPGKFCVAVDGDGSFNMTFTELKTVAERRIPVKIMVLDNECQMMVEYWQKLFFDDRLIAVRNEKNPEYTKLAEAFGIKTLYADREEDLDEAMERFLWEDPDEPVLFHVRIQRTPCLPLVAPGQALDNMILKDDSQVEFDRSASPS